MPWEIRGKCVYKKGSDTPIKCHESVEKAKAHMRALYANTNESLQEFSMYITKATVQDGLMRWSAVNSDTESDLYGEKMTIGLYQKMLSYIKNSTPPPEEYRDMVCSDYWCGEMPYLSIAHYPDLNGLAVPGQPLELFIDGTQLKAKGILFNSKLGRAVWKSLKEEEKKIGADDNRIRISIAFLDLAHKHGDDGKVFERKSIDSVCPECRKGVGNKVYLDGYLVHLALTTVPVNPRTIMQAEDIMPKKSKVETRKEDALSIVQDSELVEEIAQAALETKSDVLVEMSDTDVETLDVPVLTEEAKTKKEDDPDEDMPMSEEEKKKHKEEMKSLTEEDVIRIAKAVVAEVQPKPVAAEVVDAPKTEKSALDLATDELYNSVSKAMQMQGVALEERLRSINPALETLGTEITALVRESMGVERPAPVSNDQNLVLEAVSELKSIVGELKNDVAVLKEKSQTPAVSVQNRNPAPRSIQAQAMVSQSQTQAPVNPNSVANITRRSVSNQLPLVPR